MIYKIVKLLLLLIALTGCLIFFLSLYGKKPSIDTISFPKEQVLIAPLVEQKSEDSQVSMNTASPNTISSNTTISEGLNRFIYQPDFYYEPLSSAVIERIKGISFKENDSISYEDLSYISVLYIDFNGEKQIGEIISNKLVANDLVEIFYKLYISNYQIDKIRLIDEYNADDDLSCLDNNTSCFNYRTIAGSNKLSNHGLGLAIDINPFYNPYITYPEGIIKITPPESEIYADRTKDFPHKIDTDDLCYKLFTEYGWEWGGNWKDRKDYQHFQKSLD